MAFNINGFKARGPIDGFARPSQFAVRLAAVPPGVPSAGLADLSFACEAAQLPSSIIEPVDVPYFGRKVKIAGDRTFEDWTITIQNDENFQIRNMFEAWHNKINSLISNRQNSAPNDLMDYKVQAEVLQYGKAGPGDDTGVIRGYLFEGLFPIAINAIPLDWGRTNTYETFDVTFAYDYWIPSLVGATTDVYNPIVAPDPTSGVQ